MDRSAIKKWYKILMILITIFNSVIVFIMPYFMLDIDFPTGNIGSCNSFLEYLEGLFVFFIATIFFIIPLFGAFGAVFNEIAYIFLLLFRLEKNSNPKESLAFGFLVNCGLIGGVSAGIIFMMLMGIGIFL